MTAQLNLLSNDITLGLEKRVLPRFPLNHLLFHFENINLEVVDISTSGMQVEFKSKQKPIAKGDSVKGKIVWRGEKLDIQATVRWVQGPRFGVEFSNKAMVSKKIAKFVNIDHFIQHLRPLHKEKFLMNPPSGLKYWLRSEGPLELFVWGFRTGEIAKFQILIFQDFIEWQDGSGLKTGKVFHHRGIETAPLAQGQSEWTFQMDQYLNDQGLAQAQSFITKIPSNLLTEEVQAFLLRKIKS
jgi:hypothetical protein